MAKFLGGFFCNHKHLRFVCMTYGDWNNYALDRGGRYFHHCLDCGRDVYRSKVEGPMWGEEHE